METRTISQTTEDLQVQAGEHLRRLEGELATLQVRGQEASLGIEQLNARISQQERVGSTEALIKLRLERKEAAEILADRERAIQTIKRELMLAQAEARAATVAYLAVQHNALAEQQRTLTTKIDGAWESIMAALHLKVELGNRQLSLFANVGPYLRFSADEIRYAIQDEMIRRLSGDRKTSLDRLDQSGRRMAPGGNIIEE